MAAPPKPTPYGQRLHRVFADKSQQELPHTSASQHNVVDHTRPAARPETPLEPEGRR
jgi:hypothetical protein